MRVFRVTASPEASRPVVRMGERRDGADSLRVSRIEKNAAYYGGKMINRGRRDAERRAERRAAHRRPGVQIRDRI